MRAIRIATLFCAIFLIIFSASAGSKTQGPDFAFPTKVERDALQQYSKAIKRGNDIDALRALIDADIASTSINVDSVLPAISRVRDFIDRAHTPQGRALGQLLLAEIYSRIYKSNTHTFNSRQIPADALSTDCREWSGQQMRTAVAELIDASTADPAVLASHKLGEYAKIITVDHDDAIYYPTLLDFVASRAIGIVKTMWQGQSSQFVPASMLADWPECYKNINYTYLSYPVATTARLYDNVLKAHAADGRTAAFTHAAVSRLEWVYPMACRYADSQRQVNMKYFDALQDLFFHTGKSEYSGLVLEAIYSLVGPTGFYPPEYGVDPSQRIWLYDHCRDNIKKYPAYGRIDKLRAIVNRFEEKSLDITSPQLAYPGGTIEATVQNINIGNIRLRLVAVPDGAASADAQTVRYSAVSARKAAAEATLSLADALVPFAAESKCKVSVPAAGRYVLLADYDGMEPLSATEELPIIYATNLYVDTQRYTATQALVLNPLTGVPVAGSQIDSYRPRALTMNLGKTDSAGLLALPADAGSLTLVAHNPADGTLSAPAQVYLWNNNEPRAGADYTDITIDMLTSLALYRPGDTIDWALVAFSTSPQTRPARSAKIEVQLYDANSQSVDTLLVTTDSFGRAEGKFTITTGRLTGRYSLRARPLDQKMRGQGWKWFEVSDYKLPTFEVKLEEPLVGYPAEGYVTVRGSVTTYSGFAIPDARVQGSLSVTSWWRRWFGGGDTAFYSPEPVATDAEGRFEFRFERSLFEQSPMPGGWYNLEITAMSPSGESQQAATGFTTTPRSNLSVDNFSSLNISAPTTLPVKVYDTQRQEIADAEVSYRLMRSGAEIFHGHFSSGNPTVDWTDIPSGTYSIQFRLPAQPVDSVAIDNVALYRPTDRTSPSPDLIWTPDGSITIDGRKAEILLGTTARETSLLATYYDGRGYFRQERLSLPARLHHISVEVPDTVQTLTVNFSTVSDFKAANASVRITPRESVRGLRLEATSFRDKITPGQPEQWSLKVVDAQGRPTQAGVMIDMYNKALDRLSAQTWQIAVPSEQMRWYSIDQSAVASICANSFRPIPSRNNFNIPNITAPTFQTWGHPLYSMPMVVMMKRSMKANGMMTMVTGSASDGAMMMDAVTESAADDAESEGALAEAGTASAAPTDSYRPSEIALALFRPMLTTDTAGNLTFSFTAPDANTTWQFYALAFDQDMEVAQLARQVLSSKPLMVSANLPRFVRTGDNAMLQALVMNNSDADAEVSAQIELFDPATGAVTTTRTVTLSIAANSSQTVGIETGIVGSGISMGYRVRVTSGGFSDGEQSIIPILSTVQPVVESTTFYTAPSQSVADIKLPQVHAEDARMTLQYTGNPLWSVVTALPGLRRADISTSNTAAEAIYAAAVSQSILRRNPEVAAALRAWTSSDRSDSTLVSMLERNADLKTLLLQATPWVVNAMTDTERMTRLALLFDRDEIERSINSGIEFLSRSFDPDGGWRWSNFNQNSKPSEWVTMRVLNLMGDLNESDILPDNAALRRMIDRSIEWLDRKVAADYARNPSGTYINYVSMRLRFPKVRQSTAAARVNSACVQQIIADWRRYDTDTKAIAAVILDRSNYHSTALQLLSSIEDFGIYTPESGMTWRTAFAPYGSVYSTATVLRSFRIIDPTSPVIDRARQWLILQKEATDWGDCTATTAAVSAILQSSQRWVKPAHPTQFYLNGSEFIPATTPEQFSGYLRAALPVAEASGATLKIVKSGDAPAYGAVYTQYQADMAHIAPAGTDDLSIEKNIYVQRDGSWIAADTLRVGDRVRVELLIRNQRDMDYVAITDARPACLEPAEQLPAPVYSEGICFYRENLDAQTRMFVDRMPRGSYRLSYELFVNNAGSFTSGLAEIQSQYAPQMSAHSAGSILNVVQ